MSATKRMSRVWMTSWIGVMMNSTTATGKKSWMRTTRMMKSRNLSTISSWKLTMCY